MAKHIGLNVFLCALLIFNINTVLAADTESGWTSSTTPTEGPTSGINIGDHRYTKNWDENKKKSWAKRKVAYVLKLLAGAGKNPTDQWAPQKFSGTSTSIGYEFDIPELDFGVSTFYTRSDSPIVETWHVALNFDSTDLGSSSPLTSVYQDLTAILGTPQHENFVIITSEGGGNVKVGDLPENLGNILKPYQVKKAANNATKVVKLATGVNFFSKIKLPEAGALKVVEQALLLGGKVDEGFLYISGSVGYDLLGKLMDDGKLEADKTEQQTADAEAHKNRKEAQQKEIANDDKRKDEKPLPPVALQIMFPSVIPAPFSLMDATEAKRTFFMKTDKTSLGIGYDKASKKLDLFAAQDVTIWINNQDYVTKRKIAFAKDQSVPGDSTYDLKAIGSVENMNLDLFDGFKLKKLSLKGSTKININKPPTPEGEETTWQTGSISDGAERNGGIQIGGHREKTTKTEGWQAASPTTKRGDTVIGEHRIPQKKKTTDLKIVFGVTVDSTDLGELTGALGLTVTEETNSSSSKARVKEVFMQFDGDAEASGLNLADIKLLKDIPVVNEIAINSLGIGISETAGNKEGLDFYLYSGLTWTKPDIKGQLAVMKRGKDFYVMSRVTDFSVKKVVDSLPKSGALDTFSKPLESFEMPNAMLVFSTAAGDDERDGGLNLSDLPTPIQTMFNGIVSGKGKVPLYGEGISIIGAIDVSKDENLKNAVADLGIETSGPIVMGGSLGGFQSGKLKVAFYLDIPTIELPKKTSNGKDNEMKQVVQVNNAGGQFFISVDAAGPTFKTGIRADVEMLLPRVAGTEEGPDIVAMGGDFYLNIDAAGVGVRFAGYTKGDWHDPLGFEDIILKETAILIGTDFSGGLEVGIGSTLSFQLTSAGATPVAAKDFTKVFNKGEIKARLKELQARMESGQTKTNDVDLSAGFIIALNTTPALGIPVPKKLGFAFKNNQLSLPNVVDIFDLFLKGLLTGPAQQGLRAQMLEGSVQQAVFDEIVGGFDEVRWVPPSQKIQMLSPVPLDAISFQEVDIFFATPGAILPGYDHFDGNIGVRVAGNLILKNNQGQTSKITGVDIDLTLNGLNFGEFAEDIEKAYLSIASVTIDPLKAEFNCPEVPSLMLVYPHVGHARAVINGHGLLLTRIMLVNRSLSILKNRRMKAIKITPGAVRKALFTMTVTRVNAGAVRKAIAAVWLPWIVIRITLVTGST